MRFYLLASRLIKSHTFAERKSIELIKYYHENLPEKRHFLQYAHASQYTKRPIPTPTTQELGLTSLQQSQIDNYQWYKTEQGYLYELPAAFNSTGTNAGVVAGLGLGGLIIGGIIYHFIHKHEQEERREAMFETAQSSKVEFYGNTPHFTWNVKDPTANTTEQLAQMVLDYYTATNPPPISESYYQQIYPLAVQAAGYEFISGGVQTAWNVQPLAPQSIATQAYQTGLKCFTQTTNWYGNNWDGPTIGTYPQFYITTLTYAPYHVNELKQFNAFSDVIVVSNNLYGQGTPTNHTSSSYIRQPVFVFVINPAFDNIIIDDDFAYTLWGTFGQTGTPPATFLDQEFIIFHTPAYKQNTTTNQGSVSNQNNVRWNNPDESLILGAQAIGAAARACADAVNDLTTLFQNVNQLENAMPSELRIGADIMSFLEGQFGGLRSTLLALPYKEK